MCSYVDRYKLKNNEQQTEQVNESAVYTKTHALAAVGLFVSQPSPAHSAGPASACARTCRLLCVVQGVRLVMGCTQSSQTGHLTSDSTASEFGDTEQARQNAVVTHPTATFDLGNSGFSLRYACLSQRGYNPHDLYEENQDTFRIVRDLSGNGMEILFGVFDGHGEEGSECARFARREVSGAILKAAAAQQRGSIEFDGAAICKQAMLTLNRQLHETEECNAAYSGTTALLAWFCERTLYVSNVRPCLTRVSLPL